MRWLARHATALVLSASCSLAVASASASARADTSATEDHVQLELRGCVELSESALREHLELELSTLGLSQVEARLLLGCEAASVTIELYRATGERYPVQVRVALGDTAKPARERLVALAASELLAQAERTRENERAQPSPVPRPLPAPGAEPEPVRVAPAATSTRSRRIELFAAGNAALDGAPRVTLWGGSIGAGLGLTRTWSVLVDTRLERGEQTLPIADVRWTVLSGFVGAGASANAWRLRLSAGLGVRAGWLALAARASAPDEGLGFTAPWAGVALPLRAVLDVGGLVAPFVGVEGGYVLAPVRGNLNDGSVLMEQRGAWLSGSAGLVIAL